MQINKKENKMLGLSVNYKFGRYHTFRINHLVLQFKNASQTKKFHQKVQLKNPLNIHRQTQHHFHSIHPLDSHNNSNRIHIRIL